MLRVCYTFRGCACGYLLPPLHTFTGYIHASWVSSLLVYFQWQFLRPQTADGAKVQIPTLFCLWLIENLISNRVRFGVLGGRGFFHLMTNLLFPITEIDNDKFQVVVDMALYAKEAIVAACYKFTDRFFVHQHTEGDSVCVVFESKEGNAVSEETVKRFCNELIDQQVRYNTNQQFGHIRDLIVEEAFKPVNK